LLKINNDRALKTGILKQEFSEYLDINNICTADSVENAYDMISDGETAAAIGSLYLAGEVLRCTNEMKSSNM